MHAAVPVSAGLCKCSLVLLTCSDACPPSKLRMQICLGLGSSVLLYTPHCTAMQHTLKHMEISIGPRPYCLACKVLHSGRMLRLVLSPEHDFSAAALQMSQSQGWRRRWRRKRQSTELQACSNPLRLCVGLHCVCACAPEKQHHDAHCNVVTSAHRACCLHTQQHECPSLRSGDAKRCLLLVSFEWRPRAGADAPTLFAQQARGGAGQPHSA